MINLIVRLFPNAVIDTGVNTVNLTFDNCAINISMTKKLSWILTVKPETLIIYCNANDCNEI